MLIEEFSISTNTRSLTQLQREEYGKYLVPIRHLLFCPAARTRSEGGNRMSRWLPHTSRWLPHTIPLKFDIYEDMVAAHQSMVPVNGVHLCTVNKHKCMQFNISSSIRTSELVKYTRTHTHTHTHTHQFIKIAM